MATWNLIDSNGNSVSENYPSLHKTLRAWMKENPDAKKPTEARGIKDFFTRVVKIPEASWTAAERSATPIVEEGDVWLHIKRNKEYQVTCLAYRDLPEGGSETHVVHESGGFHLTRPLSEFQNGNFYLKSSNFKCNRQYVPDPEGFDTMLNRYQKRDLDVDQILEFLGIDPAEIATQKLNKNLFSLKFNEFLRGVYSNLKDDVETSRRRCPRCIGCRCVRRHDPHVGVSDRACGSR